MNRAASRTPCRLPLLVGAFALAAGLLVHTGDSAAAEPPAAPQPALTVTAVSPKAVEWPRLLEANGNISAWQEAIIGAEISNYRLTEVLVDVGDTVKKGQLLVTIANDTVATELAQAKAAVAEAEAMLAEARANGDRARQLKGSGAMSAQLITQYLTAEQTALARLNAARAKVESDELRLSKTRVLAPDDGIVSARSATVGSLAQPGQELLRLIRGGRLEWRAEVTEADLQKIKTGMKATLTSPGGARVEGKVRRVAPTVDPQTRTGLVYVDLPPGAEGVRAGMFATGRFELDHSPALTLPQSAVLLRDGFAYVFRIDGDKVAQVKVTVGRRSGDRIEVTGGIGADTRVVGTGAGFLNDGDTVRLVDAPAASAPVSVP